MLKGQNWWFLSYYHYDGIEVYRFFILELLKSCHEIEMRMESFFGAVWKGRKDATGKFHGAAVWKYFKTYLGMKFFMCIYSLWAAWGKSEFFTRSAWREFIFYDKSIIFSMRNWFEVSLYQGVCCIQEIYPNTSWQARYWVHSFARSWKMFRKMWS